MHLAPTLHSHPPHDLLPRTRLTTRTPRNTTQRTRTSARLHRISHQQVQECLEKYQELKQGKKLSYIIYGISDDKKSIIVLKTSESRDFEEFVADLPEKECRWAVYDFEYELPGEGIRNKLVFVQW